VSANCTITLNEEFLEAMWVTHGMLKEMDLNEAAKITFLQKGLLQS